MSTPTPEDRAAAAFNADWCVHEVTKDVHTAGILSGDDVRARIVAQIKAAENEAWNAGLLRAAKTLEDAMRAQGMLMQVGVDMREEQAWGTCMVFAIKDHLRTT